MLSTIEMEALPDDRWSGGPGGPTEPESWPGLSRGSLVRAVLRPNQDLLRRQLSVLVAVLVVVLALPLMLVIAAGIRVSTRGPVLVREPRVGLDRRSPFTDATSWRRSVDLGGRLFTLYRFRTTAGPMPESKRGVWGGNGPEEGRVFPLGRLLRKYRLDGLPQLINVLRGDMNIVGPRPDHPDVFRRAREAIPHYPSRQRVLPGITGLAQVTLGPPRPIDLRRVLASDLRYIDHRSVTGDLRIMLRTLPRLVPGAGPR